LLRRPGGRPWIVITGKPSRRISRKPAISFPGSPRRSQAAPIPGRSRGAAERVGQGGTCSTWRAGGNASAFFCFCRSHGRSSSTERGSREKIVPSSHRPRAKAAIILRKAVTSGGRRAEGEDGSTCHVFDATGPWARPDGCADSLTRQGRWPVGERGRDRPRGPRPATLQESGLCRIRSAHNRARRR